MKKTRKFFSKVSDLAPFRDFRELKRRLKFTPINPNEVLIEIDDRLPFAASMLRVSNDGKATVTIDQRSAHDGELVDALVTKELEQHRLNHRHSFFASLFEPSPASWNLILFMVFFPISMAIVLKLVQMGLVPIVREGAELTNAVKILFITSALGLSSILKYVSQMAWELSMTLAQGIYEMTIDRNVVKKGYHSGLARVLQSQPWSIEVLIRRIFVERVWLKPRVPAPGMWDPQLLSQGIPNLEPSLSRRRQSPWKT